MVRLLNKEEQGQYSCMCLLLTVFIMVFILHLPFTRLCSLLRLVYLARMHNAHKILGSSFSKPMNPHRCCGKLLNDPKNMQKDSRVESRNHLCLPKTSTTLSMYDSEFIMHCNTYDIAVPPSRTATKPLAEISIYHSCARTSAHDR